MQAQNTDPKPARQDLLVAWAAYEAALQAAEAGGREFGLSMAASDAWTEYDKLNRRIAGQPLSEVEWTPTYPLA
jgi:hypothetical protein